MLSFKNRSRPTSGIFPYTAKNGIKRIARHVRQREINLIICKFLHNNVKYSLLEQHKTMIHLWKGIREFRRNHDKYPIEQKGYPQRSASGNETTCGALRRTPPSRRGRSHNLSSVFGRRRKEAVCGAMLRTPCSRIGCSYDTIFHVRKSERVANCGTRHANCLAENSRFVA